MNVIDLTVDSIDITGPIDLTDDGVQDIMDLIEQKQPEHEDLNGYISDDGFVVAPGEGESEIDEDEDLPDALFGEESEQYQDEEEDEEAEEDTQDNEDNEES